MNSRLVSRVELTAVKATIGGAGVLDGLSVWNIVMGGGGSGVVIVCLFGS